MRLAQDQGPSKHVLCLDGLKAFSEGPSGGWTSPGLWLGWVRRLNGWSRRGMWRRRGGLLRSNCIDP